MTITTAAAPSENLSTEDAIASLVGDDAPDDSTELPAGDVPEPEALEDSEGGEGDEEIPEGEGEDDPEGSPEPAVAAPPFWPEEDKALWSKIPAAAREAIRRAEDNRNQVTAESLRKSAEARKAANAEAAQLAQLSPRIAALADQAQAQFDKPVEGLIDSQGNPLQPVKWSAIDWPGWHKSDPIAASVAWTRFQSEKAETEQLQAANRVASDQALARNFGQYHQEQEEALRALNPDLSTKAELRQAVGKHLIERGYTPEELRGIGAKDMDVAYDAMRWRALQAKTQQAPKPGATPPRTTTPQARPLRTSAGAGSAPSKSRAAQEAAARFSKSGSTDDAVALLLSRGGG